MRLISLGLSCQTKFSIDLCSADFLSLPFDYNTTTKSFVLDAFATEGTSFLISLDEAIIYQMPIYRQCGILAHGTYCGFRPNRNHLRTVFQWSSDHGPEKWRRHGLSHKR